jgi:hypothetical protein
MPLAPRRVVFITGFALVFAAACHANAPDRSGSAEPAAPATPPPASKTATPAVTPQPATADCVAEANTTVPIAMRPGSKDVFGQLDPAAPVTITARSASGWLGFDPAVAQAANVGPFRLRWLDPTKVTTKGNCAAIKPAWTPEPDRCFEMTMEDLPVLEAPKAGAKELVTLHQGEFAEILGAAGKGWVKVDLTKGNTGKAVSGYIPAESVNVNGPCTAVTSP